MPLDFSDVIKSRAGVQDKLKDFRPRKEPARVVFQNPAQGAPLLKGMTVEVRLLSPSDVAIGDLVDDVPLVFKDVAIIEFTKYIDTNPAAAAILRNESLPADKRAEFVNSINSGMGQTVLKGTLSESDAGKAFEAMKILVR